MRNRREAWTKMEVEPSSLTTGKMPACQEEHQWGQPQSLPLFSDSPELD